MNDSANAKPRWFWHGVMGVALLTVFVLSAWLFGPRFHIRWPGADARFASGTVVNELGKPIRGALLIARPADGSQWDNAHDERGHLRYGYGPEGQAPSDETRLLRTDAQGRYRFAYIGPSRWWFWRHAEWTLVAWLPGTAEAADLAAVRARARKLPSSVPRVLGSRGEFAPIVLQELIVGADEISLDEHAQYVASVAASGGGIRDAERADQLRAIANRTVAMDACLHPAEPVEERTAEALEAWVVTSVEFDGVLAALRAANPGARLHGAWLCSAMARTPGDGRRLSSGPTGPFVRESDPRFAMRAVVEVSPRVVPMVVAVPTRGGGQSAPRAAVAEAGVAGAMVAPVGSGTTRVPALPPMQVGPVEYGPDRAQRAVWIDGVRWRVGETLQNGIRVTAIPDANGVELEIGGSRFRVDAQRR